MGRQTSPNPPEMFSKRLATESKLTENTSLEKYVKFLVRIRGQNSEPIMGQFSYVDLTQKNSAIFPTSTLNYN